jgi:hypothetical protein
MHGGGVVSWAIMVTHVQSALILYHVVYVLQ